MDTPGENPNSNDAEPTLEEMKQELSNTYLQERGILFTTQYLLFRKIMANGVDLKEKMAFHDILQQLKQLFPQREGERLAKYLKFHSDTYWAAFNWAKDKAEQELKVRKMAEQLKRRSPKATNEALEAEARQSIEMAEIFDGITEAIAQAAGEIEVKK